MIRLEKLHIHKLGNISPNTALTFGARGALLLGRNGTGKTTLLNLIAMALRCDWHLLDHQDSDGFDLEYAIHVAPPRRAVMQLQVRLKGTPVQRNDWTWMLFDQPLRIGHSLTISVADAHGAPVMNITAERHKTTYSFPDRPSVSHPQSSHDLSSAFGLRDGSERPPFEGAPELAQYLRRSLALLNRYDEALYYFDNLTDAGDREPRVLVSFAYQGQDFRAADYHSILISEPTCRALQEVALADPEAAEHPRLEVGRESSTAMGSLPWLQTFCTLCGFDKVSISLPLVDSKTSSNNTIVTYGTIDLRFSVHGANLRDAHLSFGQKRLFSLLHYFDAHDSLVLADELVNGFHHEWIRHCVDLLTQKQAFLSSQNPLLFDFMYFSSAQEAAERFIECDVDEQGRFVWRNMSLADATEFYELYETGLQHVSQILSSRGYW